MEFDNRSGLVPLSVFDNLESFIAFIDHHSLFKSLTNEQKIVIFQEIVSMQCLENLENNITDEIPSIPSYQYTL